MDRLTFLESISGIQYPEMIVQFFDQFIALKQLVENYGNITVQDMKENRISFVISFKNQSYKEKALSNIQSGPIIIYGKLISVNTRNLSDTDLKITLQ